MEPFADVSCILKVDVHCDACKMNMVQVLSSVCGVYSLTIDAKAGEVRVCGEVDPNILVKALTRTGKHAEVVYVKLKHPGLTPRNHYYANDNRYYRPPYGGHGHNYGALDHYDYYNTMAMRRPMVEQPYYYGSGHSSPYPPPRYHPFYY
ncbi:heavy metal-associated isoprenylated plant protein 44-like [Nicotiana tabacum]|uniref:Heavy metal-associated isoprenylated plant protein 44-like n=1 Tax=Nicotiana tabacum TaxID=4097 RepID=A0AC58TUY2_TOBAC